MRSEKFNQPLNLWNTANVTNMDRMFYDARVFNQDISNWNVSSVITHNEFYTGIIFPAYMPHF